MTLSCQSHMFPRAALSLTVSCQPHMFPQAALCDCLMSTPYVSSGSSFSHCLMSTPYVSSGSSLSHCLVSTPYVSSGSSLSLSHVNPICFLRQLSLTVSRQLSLPLTVSCQPHMFPQAALSHGLMSTPYVSSGSSL